MMYLVGIILFVYCVCAYGLWYVFLSISKHKGHPTILYWIFFPLAPIILPFVILKEMLGI